MKKGASRNLAFDELYRETFALLGYRLTPRNSIADSTIDRAEARLGMRVPTSLRCYFRLAGRERRFNSAYNRLLGPSEWIVDSGRLVFMEENQAVVVWGVALGSDVIDPAVDQGVNSDQVYWYREHDHCSEFLKSMLCWQGAFGGAMRNTATAKVPKNLTRKLTGNWRFVGEVNQMHAYCRPGDALCFVKWDDSWRIFVGSTTKSGLQQVASDLQISWDD